MALMEFADRETKTIRASAALTTGFVAATFTMANGAVATSWNMEGANFLALSLAFPIAASGFQLKIEYSDDKSAWYQDTDRTTANPTLGIQANKTYVDQFIAAGNYYKKYYPVIADFVKVSAIAIAGTPVLAIKATKARV